MFANPTSAAVIQGIRESLAKDIMPDLQSDPARVTLAMIDTMLVSLQRRIPVEQQWMADECNRMRDLLARMRAAIAHEAGPDASALRLTLDQEPDFAGFAPIPDFDQISGAYRELSEVFTEALGHLNAMTGVGSAAAAGLLHEARAYINLRVQRDMAGFFAMDAGLVGRG